MRMLDGEGRLFGRFNLIDVTFALFVFALVPIGYASWLLFRTPPPVVESISPSVVTVNPKTNQQIAIRGRNLRPFLQAWVGGVKGVYLFESSDRAHVQLPELPPGTYDLTLYDTGELAKFRDAITVQPAPPPKPAAAPRPEMRWVQLLVRFFVRPEVVQQMDKADRDARAQPPSAATPRPVVISHSPVRIVGGNATPEQVLQGDFCVFTAVIRTPATKEGETWQYDGQFFQAGNKYRFAGVTYVLTNGEILKVDIGDVIR